MNLKEHVYKSGDLVRLKVSLVDKVINHKAVFQTYHPIGGPREWVCTLAGCQTMRVTELEHDHKGECIIGLASDPCEQLWQQDWFELVAEENFNEVEDLFNI